MLAGDLRQNHVGVSTRLVGDVGTRLAGVVQGYRPQVDWGGDSGSATIVVGGHNVRLATSGWRRRCLYMLLLALLALSVVNLSLTLWILKTVHFNMDGMGHLSVVPRGLQMDGVSEFSQKMYVARMLSRKEEDLPIHSYYNLTIQTSAVNTSLDADEGDAEVVNATADDGQPLRNIPAYMHINVDDILTSTRQFSVRDLSGRELFKADRHGTTVGADKFTVTGSEGAEMAGSMQTPHIYSKGAHELRLDSVTRDIKIRCKDELRVKARNGDISSICTSNVSMVSKGGALRFDNPSIYMPRLTIEGEDMAKEILEAEPPPTQSPIETQIPPPNRALPSSRQANWAKTTPMPTQDGADDVTSPADVQVFQVCVCPSGKLFAVDAKSICVPDDKVCR